MDLNGFKGLPFKFNATSKAVQYFYCKAHRVRDPHPDHCKDRTLFVINIPPYVTEDCLRRVFGKCGEIQRVFFYMKPASGDHKGEAAKYFTDATSMAGFKLAYVVFYKPEHLQNALDLNVSEPEILYDSQNLPLVGIKSNTLFTKVDALLRKINLVFRKVNFMFNQVRLLFGEDHPELSKIAIALRELDLYLTRVNSVFRAFDSAFKKSSSGVRKVNLVMKKLHSVMFKVNLVLGNITVGIKKLNLMHKKDI